MRQRGSCTLSFEGRGVMAHTIRLSRNMDCFETYYTLNQRLLSLTGLWPKEKSKNTHFRTYFITFFVVTSVFQQTVQLFETDLKLDSIIESLYILVPGVCIAVCYYTVLFSPSKISNLVDCIDRDWKELVYKQEWIIMEKYANESKICSLILVGIFYSFMILFISPSVFRVFMYNFGNRNNTVLTLPMPARHFIDGSMMYYILFVYQIVTIITVTTIAVAIYTSFLTCVQHACTLFSIIIWKLNLSLEKDENYVWLSNEVNESYNWMVDITKRYEEAIKFVELINALSENAYLIEIMMAMFFLIINFLYLFQISTLMNNILESLSILIYIPGSTAVLYMNCYFGQRLMDHSMQIFETSFHVPFYNLPPKCHKPLLLLVMRSTKPCKLSIGGVFAASHNFFSELMQKSYSYAMVCYTVR